MRRCVVDRVAPVSSMAESWNAYLSMALRERPTAEAGAVISARR